MRRRLLRIALILLLFPPLLAAVAGWLAGPAFLHPLRRERTPDLIREADASFAVTGAAREDFEIRAPDGALLRGWKVRAKIPMGIGSFSSTVSRTTVWESSVNRNSCCAPAIVSS